MKPTILITVLFLSLNVMGQQYPKGLVPPPLLDSISKNKPAPKKISPHEQILSINDVAGFINSLKDKMTVTEWEKVLNAMEKLLAIRIEEWEKKK